MFSQILTAFQGLLSRAFWLGSFLPVAVVAALHLALVEIAFPGRLPVREWVAGGFSSTATSVTVAVAALVVVAHALTPLTPVVREFLDGRLMPDWLHDALRRDRVADWRAADKRVRLASADLNRFELLRGHTFERIWAARRTEQPAAEAAKTADEPTEPSVEPQPTEQLVDEALEAIEQWRSELGPLALPCESTTNRAVDKLLAALSSHAPTSRAEGATEQEDALSQRLDRAANELSELITASADEARYRFERIVSRDYRLVLYPTRVGDARWAAERYSQDFYGVAFDFVWPRIQLLMKKDQNAEFMQRLADARSQVDAAVLMLALTATVPAFWLPALLVTASSPWLILLVGIASPLLLTFLYELVVQTQVVFGDIVRGAIDRYRLDVLTGMLRQPLPGTLQAERSLWLGVKRAGAPGNSHDLSYHHPA